MMNLVCRRQHKQRCLTQATQQAESPEYDCQLERLCKLALHHPLTTWLYRWAEYLIEEYVRPNSVVGLGTGVLVNTASYC